MNILHMKYAVEVAKAGSLNKASEALLIAVPQISRSIKELEAASAANKARIPHAKMFLMPTLLKVWRAQADA